MIENKTREKFGISITTFYQKIFSPSFFYAYFSPKNILPYFSIPPFSLKYILPIFLYLLFPKNIRSITYLYLAWVYPCCLARNFIFPLLAAWIPRIRFSPEIGNQSQNGEGRQNDDDIYATHPSSSTSSNFCRYTYVI